MAKLYCSNKETYFLLIYFGHQASYSTALQHHNATSPPVAQHHTTQFLADNNVKILSWPSTSPDSNPNKHTWNKLDRCIQGSVNAPANVCELLQALKQEWVAIPAHVIHKIQ